jgi:tetratricopeptide (TPR) repeat protein
VWPDPRVEALVNENFLPARLHVREDAADYQRIGQRYSVQWTPTTLLLDPAGVERHRIEGFLPAHDFMAQLTLGLGHLALRAERWSDAERWYAQVLKQFPDTDAAPEALYWAGVSRYKAGNDPGALAATVKAFETRYQDSSWAKKASVWKQPAPRQPAATS